MPKVRLTDPAVKKYRGGAARREIRDADAKGLYLVIQPSGAKSWAMRLRRPSGKSAKLHLGPVYIPDEEAPNEPVAGAPLSLAAARKLAADLQHQRATGRDVVGDHLAGKHQRRVEAKAGAASAFGILVPRFVAEYTRRGKRPRRMAETARMLGLLIPRDGGVPEVVRRGLCDRWREKPVAEIDRREIRSVVAEVQQDGVPGLERRSKVATKSRARAMLVALSTFFRWCLREEFVVTNPCRDMPRPDAPKARDRVLSDAEIVSFWRGCDKVGEPFGAALRLLLLTGCRLNEVAGMCRHELSGDLATWSIPGTRTKNGKPHAVSLAPMAREIVASVRRISGEQGLIFTTTGETPISGWSKIKRRLDKEMGDPAAWRLHDLRRTAASGMQRLGMRVEIIERALNHISGSYAGITGTYQRDPMLDDTRAALLRWSQHVAGLVSGQSDKIVPLKRKGKTQRG